MAFEGFELSQAKLADPAGEVSLRMRRGGSGPPLLLLRGHPETRKPGPKLGLRGRRH